MDGDWTTSCRAEVFGQCVCAAARVCTQVQVHSGTLESQFVLMANCLPVPVNKEPIDSVTHRSFLSSPQASALCFSPPPPNTHTSSNSPNTHTHKYTHTTTPPAPGYIRPLFSAARYSTLIRPFCRTRCTKCPFLKVTHSSPPFHCKSGYSGWCL